MLEKFVHKSLKIYVYDFQRYRAFLSYRHTLVPSRPDKKGSTVLYI